MLANPEEQTLVFARTRADVARTAKELREAGFAVSSLSGEMEQPERNRALAAFKRGKLRVLVATDVAARGIDVQDIARVIHAEPPTTPTPTRIGAAAPVARVAREEARFSCRPSGLSRTAILLKRARVQFRIEPIPTADDIQRSLDDRYLAALTEADPEGFAGHDPRLWALAEKLAAGGNVTRTLARLLSRTSYAGPTAPRQVRAFAAPVERAKTRREEPARPHAHAVRLLALRNATPPRQLHALRNATPLPPARVLRNATSPHPQRARLNARRTGASFRFAFRGARSREPMLVGCSPSHAAGVGSRAPA